jgi:hypothetical protein
MEKIHLMAVVVTGLSPNIYFLPDIYSEIEFDKLHRVTKKYGCTG